MTFGFYHSIISISERRKPLPRIGSYKTMRRLSVKRFAPEDKNRNEVLGAAVNPLHGSQKVAHAATIASDLKKVEPENEAWWINLAYSLRRVESVEGGSNSTPRASDTSRESSSRVSTPQCDFVAYDSKIPSAKYIYVFVPLVSNSSVG